MLILHTKNEIIDKATVIRGGTWFTLPNNNIVSPAENGWTDGEYFLSETPAPPAVADGFYIETKNLEVVDGLLQWTITTKPTPDASTNPVDYDLTPRQFHIFAAMWEYDDAIDAVLAGIKTMSIAQYASIKGDMLGAKVFRFSVVMGLIGNANLAPFIPDGTDVTLATMSDRWLLAKAY